MHYLSPVYFVNQPPHVSGIFVAHHQETYYVCTTIGAFCAFQLTVCWLAGLLEVRCGWAGVVSDCRHKL